MATKKPVELDARIVKIAKEEYADFEKYLPTIQDKAMFRRKQEEYWDKISARVREELSDGRTADDAVNG